MAFSLGELAVRFGCELRGDPELQIESVGTLAGGAGVLGFAASAAYREALQQTALTAVVLDSRLAPFCPTAALVCRSPHATWARIAALLHPLPVPPAGIHPRAVVDPAAQVDVSASIGPFAVVGAGAVVGPRCEVGPHCVIEAGAQLAPDVRLVARVFVGGSVSIGPRCILHPGVVLGADGFGNARDESAWIKVPQLGGVRVGADVEIGANTTIDRGALDDTVIEEGVKLDNQIQIAHNVVIGAHTAIAACVGIAGSTRIGKRCMIGGGTGINGQITLGDDIVITGFGMITRSLDKPGIYSSVIPVEEVRQWRRIVGRLKRIDTMAARIAALEAAAGTAPQPQDDNND
ncbi:MAG: UDP-3-O-(3-hydroxymyristoyl)glucosamine N-acyltransferase [Pseudomonadota bacterium]